MNSLLLIYGKIIVDGIKVDADQIHSSLGGGGPQATYGMRLWHDSVAFVTRSGTDLEPALEQNLRQLGVDLSSWLRFPDIPTPRGLIEYEKDERMIEHGLTTSQEDWFRLLNQPLHLTEYQQQAAGIHLITEFGDEPMTQTALAMQRHGALVSLEPIFAANSCNDRPALLEFARQVDIVTPDWHDASLMAGSNDLATVLRFWAGLGPRAIAIRHGARGSYVWDRERQQAWHIPILPVTVIDPTGAGNAYGGGWCAGWHDTHDARVAACYATVSATLMIGAVGIPELTSLHRQRAKELLDLALSQTTAL
jgi:sugar/nucleoside kinase (ribokinase family)